MKVVVTKQFQKDVEKELSQSTQLQLADVLESMRAAGTLKQIANLKKLKGYKTAYRIRMGEHRIAFVIEDEVIKLSRVMNRKEIYRYFP